MSFLDDLFNPSKPYEDAQNEMEDKWQQAQGFQQPYTDAGKNQIGQLNQAENNLLDPSSLLANWMGKYQTSPYAKQSMDNAKESGLDAASSMGLMGSSTAINNIQNSSSNIMNADRQQFLNDLMQKYLSGIGIGQNMFGTGATTAGNLGHEAVNVGGNTAEMAYGAAAAPQQLLKDLLASGAKAALMAGTGGAGAFAGAGASAGLV